MCRLFHSTSGDAGFATKFGFDYTLMVWPHPSPVSRWHNSAENREKLRASFDALARFMESIASEGGQSLA